MSLASVTFKTAGKLYDFDTGGLLLVAGDLVVVETERGTAFATVARPAPPVGAATLGARSPRVLRKADARDLARHEANLQHEHEARRLCLGRIRDRRMSMKLIQVEYLFDASKAIFYFCAEGRVDFRELVRDLAQTLHIRIEMKQIGARDETKLIGGIGPCGRELCCSTWLREFQAVSVKMAKEQGLSLNPSKLSGMCGRLKCCLRYEYDTYLELRRALPRIGARVTSLKGDGEVVKQNVLRQTAIVRRTDDGVEVEVTLEDLVEKRAE
ncbi:MAG: stage 0 sporulation family protein [Deltaproteobacteria bacterium]|nr:stage 0 sporulation family protein [Deltaproteobacteria bacterium]